MCGIWLSIGASPPPGVIDVVGHRGPDGRGWQEFNSRSGKVVMAHRRLAILDLSSSGLQPMQYRDGAYWITYNGEIYNYLELRNRLEASGHVFHSTCDTEVLVAAYAEWGEGALEQLRGMFAFAIYQPATQTVFVARDRFGIKPLYYACWHGGIAFASEIKQLLALPGFEATLNKQRAFDYLAGGLTEHSEDTLFQRVFRVRGGHCARLDLASSPTELIPQISEWYRLPEPGTLVLSEQQAAERFRTIFCDSIEEHMVSDVAVGSCLSGGLDSSSIVAIAAQLADQRRFGEFITVSSGFEQSEIDERNYIDAVVKDTGVRSELVFPDPASLRERLSDLIWHQDEPFNTLSSYIQWCVFERAHDLGLKVMLDGQGADEQLAGYHSFFSLYLNELAKQRRFAMLAWTILGRRWAHNAPISDQVAGICAGVPLLSKAKGLRRPLNAPPPMSALLNPDGWRNVDQRAPATALMASEYAEGVDTIGRRCVFSIRSIGLPMLLRYEDRSSMAFSIESRVPFLDHRLVEFCVALGSSHKLVGADTKRVLRRAMQKVLPIPVLKRKDKLGFPAPTGDWFCGPLRKLVADKVVECMDAYPDLFRRAGVDDLLTRMDDAGGPDPRLWRIICFGAWGRVFGVRTR